MQAKIEDYQIHAYVIQPPTSEAIKFNIFDRVNRAGTQLNKQEMRHALYQGRATQLLEQLSKTVEFEKATGGSLKPKRMRDRYAILRVISFYLLSKNKLVDYQYKANIDELMSHVMDFINRADKQLIEELTTGFTQAMYNSYQLFDRDGFRFASKSDTRRPINLGLMELLCYVLHDQQLTPQNMTPIRQQINDTKATIDSSQAFGKAATSRYALEIKVQHSNILSREITNI